MDHKPLPAAIGAALSGGFFAGIVSIAGALHALVVAPKDEGDCADFAWLESEADVPGARSYSDGMQNTLAMADAGSEMAQWARRLQIGGQTDWFIPSQDELEIIYRNLKPTTRRNSQYARSGINISAAPPTLPYSTELPAQTTAAEFMAGGTQAFEDELYWTSTQHAANADYAWYQDFSNGSQGNTSKSASLRARAVRRFAI